MDAETNRRVGLFKIDVTYSFWIYKIYEFFVLPVRVITIFGLRRSLQILKNSKELMSGQDKVNSNEMRLSYFLIFDNFRLRGYAKSFMRLLRNAFLYNNTNDIHIEKISLIVRAKNEEARRLFTKVGYDLDEEFTENLNDPLIETEGKPLYMQLINT